MIWQAIDSIRRFVVDYMPTIFRCLMYMREKQTLTSVIEIQKKIGSDHAFFEDNLSTIFVKSSAIQSNVWGSFPNRSLIISEKCMVTP